VTSRTTADKTTSDKTTFDTKDSDQAPWEFWIDRGGTFTDCIGRSPAGGLHVAKLLSSDTAPVEGIRQILERCEGLAPGASLPASRVRLGTTVATNALLERRGEPLLLVTNCGFGDLFEIGTQERPEIFALKIVKPQPLQAQVLEIQGRMNAQGEEIEALELQEVERRLRAAKTAGLDSVAVVLLRSFANSTHEEAVAELASEIGFSHVATSQSLAGEIGFLARGETVIADAYLTPLLQRHVCWLRRELPGSQLRFMQSSGGLTEARRFRGPFALLSGPAGGVVGASRVARQSGFERAIGFDMGGTSTDVSVVEKDGVARRFESIVGGVRVKAPMLAIHTVAAGGGSLCQFDGYRLSVGPASAGSDPGPLCYGKKDASGQLMGKALALTDINYFLGRIQPDYFPFALTRAPIDAALANLQTQLAKAGQELSLDEIAAGFVEVANKSMAQAIAQVSVARGMDPREYVLVGFGGAAGQHVAAVARELDIGDVLLHPLAGLLSAYGIGVAEESWDGVRDAGRALLDETAVLPVQVVALHDELKQQGRGALEAEGFAAEEIVLEPSIDLRYRGTESALTIAEPEDGNYRGAFEAEHQTRFGYTRPDRPVEIVAARVRARVPASHVSEQLATSGNPSQPGEPLRVESVWFPGAGRVQAPVFDREQLQEGQVLQGPALVLDRTGTVLLDPEIRAEVLPGGVLHLRDQREASESRSSSKGISEFDPIRFEVFSNRFASIGEQMGAVLRNTAVSTNIKERLDYSCAVFDARGGLVANAPHIPVHLGAMSETVKAVHERFPDLAQGDVIVTNDPRCGGSHLPDITVVSPVFVPQQDGPSFFVASRGHHADIGGVRPGSMPADSTSIEEEGILLTPFKLVSQGQFDEEGLRARLKAPPYPARNPDDNVADLEAMLAANNAGTRLLLELVQERGIEEVHLSMRELQQAAAAKVGDVLERFSDGQFHFEDCLDDGTRICVSLEITGRRMCIDFAGTAQASPGNSNAPRAVVCAAVIYVLRALVDERIPLNGGCLDPVEIRIPQGSLLDPPEGAAVVGGNVETSQRVVDVLLGALGVVAASQGTMNNITFGNESFGYYETLGGGSGAGQGFDGASAVHTHMTNTRITDPEVLESRYPVRLEEFSVRSGSAGKGKWCGGEGLVRRYRFLEDVEVSLLTERRTRPPYGQAGGQPGACGRNWVCRPDSLREELPGALNLSLPADSVLQIETPGGGGYGEPPKAGGKDQKAS